MDRPQYDALLAFGANLPADGAPPAQTLARALSALEDRGVRIVAQSRFYRSPAWPAGSGPDFVNGAAAVSWAGDAPALLAVFHGVEALLGRERRGRWTPRTVDLDLIAMGGQVLPDAATQDRWRRLPQADQAALAPDTLILPHPRMQDRAFVLRPLAEIAPDWIHPRTGRTVAGMLDALDPADVAAVAPLK